MAKKKPLPYHASQRLDDISMDSAEIDRYLELLLKGAMSREEVYRLIGMVALKNSSIQKALKEIKTSNEEEGKS